MNFPVNCRHIRPGARCAEPRLSRDLSDHFRCPIAEFGGPAVCRRRQPEADQGRAAAVLAFIARAAFTTAVVAAATFAVVVAVSRLTGGPL